MAVELNRNTRRETRLKATLMHPEISAYKIKMMNAKKRGKKC